MSMKAVPFVLPMITYSVPVKGSIHPQMSFMSPPPISLPSRNESISTFSQGNTPDIPLTQGFWALKICA